MDRLKQLKLSEKMRPALNRISSGFKGNVLPHLKSSTASALKFIRTFPEKIKAGSKTVVDSKFWTKKFWVDQKTKIRSRLPQNLEDLKRMRPEEILQLVLGDNFDKARQLFVSSKAYGTYFRMAFVAFGAYFMADTVSLFTESMIPEAPIVPAPKIVKKVEKTRTLEQYSAITSRNIFSSKNIIPEDKDLENGPARKTALPLNLVGTMVLKDELKSIASIEDKSANMIFPVRVEDTVQNKIRVTKIEHLRVTFVNLSTGHLEYVEILDDFPQLNVSGPAASTPKNVGGVTQTSENKFEIEKSVIEKGLSNISQVLQSARAVPNFENGMANGYRIVEIDAGSLFESMGIKKNDVISGINGEPLNDPGKAFQLFNEIRNVQHLELNVIRNGRKSVINYDVR